MTVLELQNQLDSLRVKEGKLYHEKVDLIAQLQKCCDHRITRDYKWEHDNGYGKQNWRFGKRCTHCGAKDLWNTGTFSLNTTE